MGPALRRVRGYATKRFYRDALSSEYNGNCSTRYHRGHEIAKLETRLLRGLLYTGGPKVGI